MCRVWGNAHGFPNVVDILPQSGFFPTSPEVVWAHSHNVLLGPTPVRAQLVCHVSIVCGSTCCMKSFVGISSCSCRGAQATLHQCQSWVELGSDMVGVGCMDIV